MQRDEQRGDRHRQVLRSVEDHRRVEQRRGAPTDVCGLVLLKAHHRETVLVNVFGEVETGTVAVAHVVGVGRVRVHEVEPHHHESHSRTLLGYGIGSISERRQNTATLTWRECNRHSDDARHQQVARMIRNEPVRVDLVAGIRSRTPRCALPGRSHASAHTAAGRCAMKSASWWSTSISIVAHWFGRGLAHRFSALFDLLTKHNRRREKCDDHGPIPI